MPPLTAAARSPSRRARSVRAAAAGPLCVRRLPRRARGINVAVTARHLPPGKIDSGGHLMPWLKAGDTAATHPVVMRVHGLPGADDRSLNEVAGFMFRCYLQAAGHTTDYVLEEGTAWMLGGVHTERLLELARRAGYIKPIRGAGQRRWRLLDDSEFLHMRLRAEIDWEKQQRADAANPALTVPVRLRDGDACRYCGRVTNWGARRGGLAGTYDHRVPGKPGTVDTLVVACGACNSGRRDDPEADQRYPLRPAPARPYYSKRTAAFLADHGHTVTVTDDLRPGSRPDHATSGDTASSDPAASRTTPPPGRRAPSATTDTPPPPRQPSPSTSSPSGPCQRPSTRLDPAPAPAGSADHLPTGSGSAGSGRVGTGRDRPAGDPAGTGAARPTRPPRKRSTRGRPRGGGEP